MPQVSCNRLVDATLREGEQTPTVYFRPEEKCRIAELLRDALGPRGYIEVGQPYSPKYREGVEAVISHFRDKGYGNDRLLIHARTLREDVDIAKEVGGWGVVVVLAPSERHLLHKLNGLSYERALLRISDVVAYAKDELGFANVQYTLEDATSIPMQTLQEVSRTAQEAGADIIRIPDTKGQANLDEFRELISTLKDSVRVPIDVHCHNDRGLAVANSIGGLIMGATGVHVTVLGLGERCGIADLATLVENLESLYGFDTGVRMDKLYHLYNYVAAAAGIPFSPNQPIVGLFARTHKAGEHQKSVVRCPETYETIQWQKYGLHREYEYGAMQSKELVEHLSNELDVEDQIKNVIVEKIRSISMTKGRQLRRPEVWKIIEETTGKTPQVETVYGGENVVDAIIFIKVRPSCDELTLINKIRQRFLEHAIPIRVRDIAGDWDFIVDAKSVDPAVLDNITAGIRKDRNILETSTSIVFDEYK
ncbi:MAG: LeuA family protein [Candidatus Bathyarchaeia archaeon]